MSDDRDKLDRLLRWAAQAGEEATPPLPFGFDTRVVALARAGNNKPNGLVRLLRQVAVLSTAVLVVSAIAAFREVKQTQEIGESFSNEFAIADSAIQNEFLK